MFKAEGTIVALDGVRLAYRSLGEGPPVVIVPNGLYLAPDFTRFAVGRRLIIYDARNRGLSDAVTSRPKIERGIHQDVDDLEAVRRHFEIARVSLIGHSYMGLVAALYAIRYADHVSRLVQIGSLPPQPAKQYPAHLTNADGVLTATMARLAELQKERESMEPVVFCRKFWEILNPIYVVNPADAVKIRWERCDLPNERNFMKHWMENLLPSIQALHVTAGDCAKVAAPVLIVHGVKDRSSPYGGALDWAALWPKARLLTVQEAGHAPWIEQPDLVFGALEDFLRVP